MSSAIRSSEPSPPADLTADSEVDLPHRAVQLAADLLREAREFETRESLAHARKMERLMADESGKRLTIRLADELLRIHRPARAARRLADLLSHHGLPRFLSGMERLLLQTASWLSRCLPHVVMPRILQRMKQESRDVILPAEEGKLRRYLEERRASGMGVNLNLLGEAVLGEEEAESRLFAVLRQLEDPDVNYVSVKISSIFSQIHLVGYEETVHQVKQRLRRLYRTAMAGDADGQAKFVNLDMEEYRDLGLTVRAFREVLDEPEFAALEAGLVLQAYLPDSFEFQQRLTEWARDRHGRTGAGIKIRLVKGANLAMEQVESSLHDWEQAPYATKLEVDANYKRMLRYACQPENARAVRLGVGSHNLFDVAYALLERKAAGVEDQVEFEMLEGMANPHAQAVCRRAGGMLLYAPVVRDEHFSSAMAYLVRRLDENTAPQNFLSDLFGLQVGSPDWEEQRDWFLEACHRSRSPDLSSEPRRTQDRERERPLEEPVRPSFRNDPHTDFSLAANRRWVEEVLAEWEEKDGIEVPLAIAGEERFPNLQGRGVDPSARDREVYRFALGGRVEVDAALETARRAQPDWERRTVAERAEHLKRAAAVMRHHRGDTIGCMVMDGAKAVAEADAEVSEAVDFAEYYARSLDGSAWSDGVQGDALGTVVVTPPWNFPYAIPASGCLSALLAGNAVILKPAPETVLTAWKLAQHLWEAGVPREVVQFLPVPDDETGKALVTDDRVGAVVLTGAYDTAQRFRSWKPDLRLCAETSGKNAIIITAAADLDLAIEDLCASAFGHAGQKCSAASLALVEEAVFEDPAFRRQLRDAAQSLRVGPAWDRSAVVTPLIREPDADLHRALTTLDPGEEWLVQPRRIHANPRLWSPGVKWGVRPGSWFARTECFGPVLGVVAVHDLENALEILSTSEFGLTGGIQSLDEGEIERWKERVEVGNAYVNRTITGAIVRRQPFGGWKHSAVGPGAKAGGPNYVANFLAWKPDGLPRQRAEPMAGIRSLLRGVRSVFDDPRDREALEAAAGSDEFWWQTEFGRRHDPSQIRGERNVFRYVPRRGLIVRVAAPAEGDDPGLALQLARVFLAARRCGLEPEISLERLPDRLLHVAITAARVIMESEDNLVRRLETNPRPVRWLGTPISRAGRERLQTKNVPLHDAVPVENGRVELRSYLLEQSISETRHRYGNLIR